MCCNNHDDLLHLGFVLKISLFSEASLKRSRPSLMEFLEKIISCYLKKTFIIDVPLGSKYPPAFSYPSVNSSNMLLNISSLNLEHTLLAFVTLALYGVVFRDITLKSPALYVCL